jgi:predicted DNA-binding protein with PD1-like motif
LTCFLQNRPEKEIFRMKFSEAKPGRIFVLRLEDGEILHEKLESFAREHGIEAAALIAVGVADEGSTLVVGPERGRASAIVPLEQVLLGEHESAGVGTLFPDADGRPILHMHLACGRNRETVTGCVRRGVKVWQVMEVILWELSPTKARRLYDPATGFDLLQP